MTTLSDQLLSGSALSDPKDVTDGTDSKDVTQATSSQKWWASALIAMIFIILSSSIAYDATSCVLGRKTYYGSGATILGLLLHGLLFMLVIRFILG